MHREQLPDAYAVDLFNRLKSEKEKQGGADTSALERIRDYCVNDYILRSRYALIRSRAEAKAQIVKEVRSLQAQQLNILNQLGMRSKAKDTEENEEAESDELEEF